MKPLENSRCGIIQTVYISQLRSFCIEAYGVYCPAFMLKFMHNILKLQVHEINQLPQEMLFPRKFSPMLKHSFHGKPL